MKAQIFQEVLSAIVEETEIEKEQILSGVKSEEIVDARSLLIKVMNEKGLYPTQISQITGICARSVDRFLQDFKTRVESRKMMRINYDRVRNKLGMTED